MKPYISVIISIYNQLDYAKYNLLAYDWIYKNQFQDFEIIFADDGSSDGAGRFLEKAKSGFPIKYFWQEDKGFRRSLCQNEAIHLATGEFLLIMDGDTFPGPNTFPPFLKELDERGKRESLMGVRYKIDWSRINQKNYDPINLTESVIEPRDWRGLLESVPPKHYNHFSGANFIIARDKFLEIGGYPSDFIGFGFEDYALSLKWLESGRIFYPVNDSVAYHVKHPNTEGGEDNFLKLMELEDVVLPKLKERYPDMDVNCFPNRNKRMLEILAKRTS